MGRWRDRGVPRGLLRLPLLHREEYFAGLRAGIDPHDAVLSHEIDEAGPAAVADAEGALEERHAPTPLADHHLNGGVVHVVLVFRRCPTGRVARRCRLEVDQLRRVLRLARPHRRHHSGDLLVGEVGPLAAEDLAGSRGKEEHVTVAEEPIGTALVEDDAAVGPARHLEGDPRRQVALNQAGDDVDGRLLGSEDEMDADGPALLCQSDDVLLDLLAGGHHHVSDLVGDDDDKRHRRGDRRRLLVGLRSDPLDELVAAERVVVGEVADAHLCQEGVALLHLLHRPGEDRLRLLHVGDDRVHEMGERLVGRQFDHLRVDHQHPHLVGAAGHDHREDERVETHALARAGPTGDEEMGHRGHVDDHRIARHVLAEEQRDLERLRLGLRLLHHLPEANQLPGCVGHLDADRVLPRDRGDDPDARHAQGDRQIVGEVDDFRQAQARLELDLVLRDDRAGLDLDDADLESELGEGLLEHPRPLPHLVLLLVLPQMLRGEEELERGEHVVGPDRPLIDIHLHRPPPAGERLDRHLRGRRYIDLRGLRWLVVIGLVEAILDVIGLERGILSGGPSRGLSNLDLRALRIGFVASIALRFRIVLRRGSAGDRVRRTAATLPPRRLGRGGYRGGGSRQGGDRGDGGSLRHSARRLAATKQRGTTPHNHAPDARHEGGEAQQRGVANEKQTGGRDPADDDRRPRVGEQALGEQSTGGADGPSRSPHRTGERVGEEHRQERGGADRGDDGADGAERQIGEDAATQ